MVGMFQSVHVILGAGCILFLAWLVFLIVFLVRRGTKDEKPLSSLKEENDQLREEIEKLEGRVGNGDMGQFRKGE
jgi:hypothetical protein